MQIAARRPPRSSERFLEFIAAVVKKSKEPVVMTAVLKELNTHTHTHPLPHLSFWNDNLELER
jgi:hypothetical protein